MTALWFASPLVLGALALVWLYAQERRPGRVTVLLYHRVVPDAEHASQPRPENILPVVPRAAARGVGWGLWLEERLLAAVPHRQVVVMVPNRLPACFLYDRGRLGLLSRVVCQTVREYARAAVAATEPSA